MGIASATCSSMPESLSRCAARSRSVAKRIVSEVEIGLLVRAARTRRDRILVEVGYGGGLRVSEIVGLSWADVIERPDGKVQLNVLGKGGKVRQVLFPSAVGRSLLSLRGDADDNDPVFRSRKGGARLTVRAVNHMLKRVGALAGINRSSPRTGCGMPMAPTQWIVAPRWPRSRRRSVMTTSPPPAAICTRGRTAPAGCTSILGCFFDEDETQP